MFRRWRRARQAAQAADHVAAPAPGPSAADLRGEHLFGLLHTKLSEFLGANGEWALVRRTDDDTDRIFQAVVTHQIAAELTRAVLDEREQVAVVVPADEATLALSWTPAPLVVWAEPEIAGSQEHAQAEPVDLDETDAAETESVALHARAA